LQQWTRLIRFVALETSEVHIGQPVDPNLDGMLLFLHTAVLTFSVVGLAAHEGRTIKAYEIFGSALDPSAQLTNNVLTVKHVLTPLSREQVGFVRCLGLNYSDHAVCILICLLSRPTYLYSARPKPT